MNYIYNIILAGIEALILLQIAPSGGLWGQSKALKFSHVDETLVNISNVLADIGITFGTFPYFWMVYEEFRRMYYGRNWLFIQPLTTQHLQRPW